MGNRCGGSPFFLRWQEIVALSENLEDKTRKARVIGVESKIVVEIFGEMYPLKSEEADVEYMKKLAAMVDKHMREAAKKTRSCSGHKSSVLAALQLADDYCRLQKDYDELLALLEEK